MEDATDGLELWLEGSRQRGGPVDEQRVREKVIGGRNAEDRWKARYVEEMSLSGREHWWKITVSARKTINFQHITSYCNHCTGFN